MKRIFLLAFLCLAGVKASQAQHFSHGLGVGIFVEDGNGSYVKASYTFTYSPRISFAETDKTSLSVGIPLNIGFSGADDGIYASNGSYKIEDNLRYTINVPLMLNFNIGAGSSPACQERMGFFVGAGYAYNVGTTDQEVVGTPYHVYETESSTGPAANIGLRIGIGYKKRRNIEIRTSYMRGVTSYKPHVLGINCLFNF
jgi:hypothetical protein